MKSSGGQPSTLIASMMHKVRSKYANPLNPPFVSAFCQSNVGDTTPNTLGPYCLDSGLPCDFEHSTCNGKNELCVGRGPGYVYYYGNVFLETLKLVGLLIFWIIFHLISWPKCFRATLHYGQGP